MMSDETWLTATEIQEHFNVNLIDEEKTVENVKSDLFNTYKNTPRAFKQEEKPVENIVEKQPVQVDYSKFEQTINELKGGK
jgi:hypothetical protein